MNDVEKEAEAIPGMSHKHEHLLMIGGAIAGIMGLFLLAHKGSASPAASNAGAPQDATSQSDFQSQLAGLIYDTQAVNYDEFSAIAGKLGITNAGLTGTPPATQQTETNVVSGPGQDQNYPGSTLINGIYYNTVTSGAPTTYTTPNPTGGYVLAQNSPLAPIPSTQNTSATSLPPTSY